MSLIKTGPHIQYYSDAAREWTKIAPIVKCVDDPAPFYDAPGSSIRIFRAFFTPGQQTVNVDEDWVVETVLNRLAGYRHPNLYVQVFNEAMETGGELEVHADILDDVVGQLHRAGVKVAGIGWSMGGYGKTEWDYMRSRNWCGMDAIAINAYTVPGNNNYALRYREFWKPEDPDIIITEFNTLHGWQADGLTPQQMFNLLKWYDSEISKDKQCLGGVGFTLARAGYDWPTFELEPVVPLILADKAVDNPGWKDAWNNPEDKIYDDEEVQPVADYQFAFGFKDMHDEKPDTVGEATSEQIDIPNVCSIQFTENGILVYREGAGVKFFEQTFPLA